MPTLNIDYAAIIEKADKRRAALQEVEALLADTPKHMHALVEAMDHILALAVTRNSLDPEGIALLGDVSPAITELHQALQRTRSEMTTKKSWMHDRTPFAVLAATGA